MAKLTFELSEEIVKHPEVRLENRSPSSRDQQGQERVTHGLDGAIAHLEFIPACFLYMH